MGRYYKYKGNVEISTKDGRELLYRDLKCIINNEMWFSKLEALNDKNEGIHSLNEFISNLRRTTKFMDFLQMKKFDEEVNNNYLSAVVAVINSHKSNCGVFSLSTDGFNNLMWSHYAKSHEGYCIEYEFEDLDELQLRRSDNYHLKHFDRFKKVHYTNKVFSMSNIDFKYDNFTEIITNKTKEWSYEKEFRAIVNFAGSYIHNPSIIKSVTFGLTTREEVKEYIIKLLQNKGINFYQLKRERFDSLKLVRERVTI